MQDLFLLVYICINRECKERRNLHERNIFIRNTYCWMQTFLVGKNKTKICFPREMSVMENMNSENSQRRPVDPRSPTPKENLSSSPDDDELTFAWPTIVCRRERACDYRVSLDESSAKALLTGRRADSVMYRQCADCAGTVHETLRGRFRGARHNSDRQIKRRVGNGKPTRVPFSTISQLFSPTVVHRLSFSHGRPTFGLLSSFLYACCVLCCSYACFSYSVFPIGLSTK